VHDYQLGLVPGQLRAKGYGGRIGFFLHTPFPDVALAERVADGGAIDFIREWLGGVLGADLVGLQSPADVDRFRRALDWLGLRSSKGQTVVHGRTIRFGAYPVGFDTEDIDRVARAAPVFDALALLRADAPVVVGLEREDYTKGIPERLHAMTALWEAGVRFHYLGLASPTREGVPGYERFRSALQAAVAIATQAAERAGCTCIQEPRALTWPEVVALLRDAQVVCTSSLADGMNLVPMQAAIAQGVRPRGERGVITTGRDAGAAAVYAHCEDDGLIAVDPFDTPAFAKALRQALEGRPGRVSDGLIERVRAGDARRWGSSFLGDLLEASGC
jgi:trehalose-6-phosphate synthase